MESGIPERLREARKRLNLNQIQIAADLDIQQKSISDIENGKIQNIPNTYIYYFYKKGVSLDWIYDGKGPMLQPNITKPTGSGERNALDLLIDFDNVSDIDERKLPIVSKKEEANRSFQDSSAIFERLVDAKDYNIKTLLAYIKSLENNQEYLKNLLDKSLVAKILHGK